MKRNRIRNAMIVPMLLAGFVSLVSAMAAQQPAPAQTSPRPTQGPQSNPVAPPQTQEDEDQGPPLPTTLTEALLREIESLQAELAEMRTQLAQARLDASASQRELDQLRQFVADHQRFGDDFQQYKAVKDIAEREARLRENEQARAHKDVDKADRDAKRAAARSMQEQQNAAAEKVGKYRRMGFTALGLDVYSSKMAFFYNTKNEGGGLQVDYDTILGNYLKPYPPITDIDYSKMTISGSVLNASDEIRNIGVAITFFDDNGNQVGHETVQINNARPDVPYPFTSKIEMALNRPFASSSTFVLYADVAE